MVVFNKTIIIPLGLAGYKMIIANELAIYLTNRFHVAVRLFSNRSQMTSKCGKNKKVAHEAQPQNFTVALEANHFSANCSFFGQSFSLGHHPPIYQLPKGVYLLNMQKETIILANYYLIWVLRTSAYFIRQQKCVKRRVATANICLFLFCFCSICYCIQSTLLIIYLCHLCNI